MSTATSALPKPPVANKIPHKHKYHSQEFLDNYHWIRSDDRKSEDAINYVKAENEYAEAVMKPLQPLVDEIFEECKKRIQEDDTSLPAKHGEYYYFKETQAGKEYPIRQRRLGIHGDAEVVLDLNLIDEKTLSLGAYDPSPDNKLLAWSLDTDGSEKYTLQFKSLEGEKKILDDVIADIAHGVEWMADSEHVVYVTFTETRRTDKVWLHKVGTPRTQDRLLFREEDEAYIVDISKSMSGEYIFIETTTKTTSEVRYIHTSDSSAKVHLFAKRKENVLYSVEHMGKGFIITHNDGAINFKISKRSVEGGKKEEWTDLFEDKLVYVNYVVPFQKHLVVVERSDAVPRFRIFEADDSGSVSPSSPSHTISFDEPDYDATPMSSFDQDFSSETFKFWFNSYLTPKTIYAYNLITRGKSILKQDLVPTVNKEEYVEEVHWVELPEGTWESENIPKAVPVTVVYKKGLLKKDGSNPGYLYGYGSYGINNDPRYPEGNAIFSYLDRGFVCAYAKIRGGAECGRAWYEEEGKFLKKKNTFNDFILAAEWLVKENYTSSDRLAIHGGSAGGLLIGATINQRPELFKAYLAAVPFVDVINTMMDPCIPLTVEEYLEWGDPNDKKYFDYMLSYSPYNNIRPHTPYPNGRVTSGLWDPRVQYWEPAKWVAKQRELEVVGDGSDGSSVLVLETLMQAGHASSSGRYDRLKERAKDVAFVVHYTGASKKIEESKL
ncbi:hypothetical protein YB2330_002537 [Saitoella coloradoensis]